MVLVHSSPRFPSRRSGASRWSPVSIRSTLPFPPEKARFHIELASAVDVVDSAWRLCLDVKKSLLSRDGQILEKDRTPVTVAEFGVQALISLELGRLFPSIPLVAEEDSRFLRSSSVNLEENGGCNGNSLVDSVVSAVADKVGGDETALTSEDVLDAMDRGGRMLSLLVLGPRHIGWVWLL